MLSRHKEMSAKAKAMMEKFNVNKHNLINNATAAPADATIDAGTNPSVDGSKKPLAAPNQDVIYIEIILFF